MGYNLRVARISASRKVEFAGSYMIAWACFQLGDFFGGSKLSHSDLDGIVS